jgi:hypothetical protein
MNMPLPDGPELWAHEATTEAVVLGAFERASGADTSPVLQRGSGGPSVFVAPGTVRVALVLRHPAELTECPPDRLTNRYVRPLLRALTGLGATARYFGRDWISVEQTPAAWVGFGHDAGACRSLFEAFVATERAFAPAGRSTFMGKAPGTLRSITGRSIPPGRIVEAVVAAYAQAYRQGAVHALPPSGPPSFHADPDETPDETPWRATSEDVMGTLGAGPDREGRLRVGGALFASRDALHAVEGRASAMGMGPDPAELGRMVDEVFRQEGVVLQGVRSPRTLCDLLLRVGA